MPHPHDDPEHERFLPYREGKCKICGLLFADWKYSRAHIRDAHGGALPPTKYEHWKGANWMRSSTDAASTPVRQPDQDESLREMLERSHLDGQQSRVKPKTGV
jgi:hypothetical protein